MSAFLEPSITTGVVIAIALLAGERFGRSRERRRVARALHELRRPLQVLALGVAREAPDRRLRDAVELAWTALADLEQSAASSQPATRRSMVDVRALVDGVVARAGLGASGRRITVRWRGPSATVFGDAHRLAQAADNLVANALTHACGDVGIDVVVASGRIRVGVHDQGDSGPDGHRAPPAGRAASRLPRPGLRDRRLGPSGRDRILHGYGLGVVEEVAAAHGGRFALHRSHEGSIAVLELPLAEHLGLERAA